MISQRGDSIQAWSFPASMDQGATPKEPPKVNRPATGRISGVEVKIDDPASHYRLRYDAESHHLRGTLNGTPFWAVRVVVNRPACPAVP